MSQGTTPELRFEISPFARLGALCGAAIAIPAVLFAAEPNSTGAPIAVSMDAERRVVSIALPPNSGYTAIQAQVVAGNLTATNWFNIPGGLLSTNQSTLTVSMQDLPVSGCVFRGVTDQLSSDLRIGKQPVGDRYHIVVTVDDNVLRNKDGSLNPAQFNHWTIENSTDGVHWTSSGYQVTPGGTQFGLLIPSTSSGEPFFISRIQHVP